jgi:hypothetical protein
MRCTVCVGTLPNLGCGVDTCDTFDTCGFKPVFFVQVPVSARRLTILTMLDHWGAQVAGARALQLHVPAALTRAARAPC